MIRIVPSNQRQLKTFDAPGASVQVSDPIIGAQDCLSAGFTEYVAASRLEWTFEYNEVFYMLDGSLVIGFVCRFPNIPSFQVNRSKVLLVYRQVQLYRQE